MTLRNGYLLAGILWALLLAPVAAYAVLGFIGGVFWIYVFGDNPWPAATDWIASITGIFVFFSVAACCIDIARRWGIRNDAKAVSDRPRAWRKVYILTAVPLALIAAIGYAVYTQSRLEARAHESTQKQQAVFNDLLMTRTRISGLAISQTDDGYVDVRVAFLGERQRPFRLLWTVNSAIYGEVLSGDVNALNLDPEGGPLVFRMSRADLAGRYRDNFLGGNGALVDEPFELLVTLVPHIAADEAARWPVFERQRWENGDSPLRSVMIGEFQLHFRIEDDGTITDLTP